MISSKALRIIIILRRRKTYPTALLFLKFWANCEDTASLNK
jgi:hypothetical protein